MIEVVVDVGRFNKPAIRNPTGRVERRGGMTNQLYGSFVKYRYQHGEKEIRTSFYPGNIITEETYE